MSEPAEIDSLPYYREVTQRAKRHGWREKDVAWNVDLMAAIREALSKKEEIA
jgi:hypothetical protein